MFDQNKIEEAIRLLIEGIGEDATREGLLDTPKRVAKMYKEIFSGLEASPQEYLEKTFTVEHSDIVMEKDITFYSVCEHHFLPFHGKVHIAYLPDGKVTGLSKLARTVEVYAKRPQIQEQMTNQIANAIMQYLTPFGVMVVIEAEHMCMSMRGVNKPGTKTVTLAHRGVFTENKELRDQFFQLLRV